MPTVAPAEADRTRASETSPAFQSSDATTTREPTRSPAFVRPDGGPTQVPEPSPPAPTLDATPTQVSGATAVVAPSVANPSQPSLVAAPPDAGGTPALEAISAESGSEEPGAVLVPDELTDDLPAVDRQLLVALRSIAIMSPTGELIGTAVAGDAFPVCGFDEGWVLVGLEAGCDAPGRVEMGPAIRLIAQ